MKARPRSRSLYAVSASSAGLKVLLIDGHLRHTSASRFFGLLESPYLVDYLSAAVEMKDAIRYDLETKLLGPPRWY
jgi:Mrp family chromosome partitioning ATPase